MARIEIGFKTPSVVTVATAGVPVPLSATELLVNSVIVQWNDGNLGEVYLGEADVNINKALKLNATCPSFGLSADDTMSDEDNCVIDLSKLYVDAANNGDKVFVAYTVVTDKRYNS